MKTRKQIWAGLLVLVLVFTGLTACKSASGGKAAEYVTALLDVAYGKDTKAYTKLTDASEKDAKAYSEQAIEAQAKILAAYFGMEEPSDKVIEDFEEISRLLYAKAAYTAQDKDGKVVVSITPVTMLQSAVVQDYVDDFNVKEFVEGDASCTDESFAGGLLELLKKSDISVADKPVEVTISVSEKDGSYTISDEDLEKLDEAVIKM